METGFRYEKVWVIDDNTIDNYITDKIIKKSGLAAEVSCFTEAGMALISLQGLIESDHKIPAILFLDISMPVMNGFDFLDEFEKINFSGKKAPKIIMLSSSSDQCDMSKALNYKNVIKYLQKPFTMEAAEQINITEIDRN